jgi:hypothetical protein
VTTPSDPPPGYASDPQLEMLWTTPPEFVGTSGGGSSTKTPPLSGSFMVSMGSLQSTEQGMLGAASTIVDAYNPLEQQVQSAVNSSTIFGQQATVTVVPVGYRSAGPAQQEPDGPIQQAAQQFAPQINPSMTRALRLAADATFVCGVFIALLNHSGQNYASADLNSTIPAD